MLFLSRNVAIFVSYIAPDELLEHSKSFIGAQLDFLLFKFLCSNVQIFYISKLLLKVISVHYNLDVAR